VNVREGSGGGHLQPYKEIEEGVASGRRTMSELEEGVASGRRTMCCLVFLPIFKSSKILN
jgi:hypothetical protein